MSITLPSTPGYRSVRWQANPLIGVTQGEFSGAQQTYDWGDMPLVCTVALPPMTRDQAEEWIAKLLDARADTILFGDPVGMTPRGAGGGSPVTVGTTSAGARTISTSGWPNSTLVLKAGDWFSLDGDLKKVMADVTSDGSGAADIRMFPAARAILADGSTITTSNPTGRFRLLSPREWDINEARHFGLTFQLIEKY